MTNDYFNHDNEIARQTLGRSGVVNALFRGIASGFDKIPAPNILTRYMANFGPDIGTANSYRVDLTPPLTAYEEGQQIRVKIANTNTSSATLDVNGLGPRAIKRWDGSDVEAGDLTEGDIPEFTFDGTHMRMNSPSRRLMAGMMNTLGADLVFNGLISFVRNIEFDPADSVRTATSFLRGGTRNSLGAFGGAITLSKPNSGRPGAALVAKQTSSDEDQVGISIFTHNSGSSNNNTRESFTIDHNGFVGINNPDPTYALDVIGEARFQAVGNTNTDVINVNGDGTQAWSWFSGSAGNTGLFNVTTPKTPFRVDAGAPTNALTLAATGVGMGTGAPDAPLHLQSGSVTLAHLVRNGTGNATVKASNNNHDLFFGMDPIGNFGVADNENLSSGPTMTVRPVSRRVGINEDTPFADLHVHHPDSFGATLRLSNTEGYAVITQDNGGNLTLSQNGHVSGLLSNYGRLDIYGDNANNNHKLGVYVPNLGYTNDTVRFVHDRPGTTAFSFLRCLSNDAGSTDLELIIRGNGDVAMDGNVSSGGADYAEFFEWADGNTDGEDRRGVSVVLVGEKIRPAEAGEVPFGVISANPSVVGDADIDRWMYKYLTDDFGSPILEDYEIVEWDEANPETGETEHHQFTAEALPEGVTVPQDATRTWQERRVLNPDWDPDHEYVPRRDRAEWDCVGLMGKLRLRKGQPVAPSWIKMRDISDAVEEWLVK